MDEITSCDDSAAGKVESFQSTQQVCRRQDEVYSDDDGSWRGAACEQKMGPYGKTTITYCSYVVNGGDVVLSNVNVTMGEKGFVALLSSCRLET